jgi:Flp pilus assembly protein TadG
MSADMRTLRTRATEERGAVMIQVGVAILVLSAFAMFIVDYGLLWVSRNQAQNSADAGALAGATALALDDFNDRTPAGPAKMAARSFAIANNVWDAAPDVQMAADVRFYPDAPAAFPASCAGNDCVRVDVHRSQARGNALPMFLGFLVGLNQQGVRAMAIAQAAAANASDCMKPWAIADKWEEHNPKVAPWDPSETYDPTGATPDVYVPPATDRSSMGTSFTVSGPNNDLGRKLTLKAGNPKDAINPGWFQALDLTCPAGGGAGGNCYRNNISGCSNAVWKIGDLVPKENGNMVGPTKQGVDDLIALDPSATWNSSTKEVDNSCVVKKTCSGLTQSPRIVPVPVFDLDHYMKTGGPGNGTVKIVNILGFFVDKMDGNDVVGYLMTMPDLLVSNGGGVANNGAFIKAVRLVR